jgi:hypothetical protein
VSDPKERSEEELAEYFAQPVDGIIFEGDEAKEQSPGA